MDMNYAEKINISPQSAGDFLLATPLQVLSLEEVTISSCEIVPLAFAKVPSFFCLLKFH